MNSSSASSKISFSRVAIRSPKPAPTSARRSASSFRPSRSIAASTSTSGSSTSCRSALEPELLEPRALHVGERGDQARFLGRVEAGLDLLAQRELAVVLVASAAAPSAQADAGVGGELDQLVGPALRLEQVGGDHRVVVELELDALAGGGGEQPVAAAAERLGVVGGERPAGQRHGELVVGRSRRRPPARRRPRPSVAGDRERQPGPSARSAGVPSSASTRAPSRRCGPGTASPSGNSSSRRCITARSSNSRMKSRRAPRSGSEPIAAAEVDPGLDVVLQRRQLLRDPRVVGVLGQVLLAFCAGDLVDVASTPSSEPNCCSSWVAGLSPIPGTPGMLSEVSP